MEDIKSKSQKKREAEDLQKLGVNLLHLTLDKLDTLPLPERLKQAILEAKRIKSHGAIRRQTQLIGKLMRTSDFAAINEAYESIMAQDKAQTADFHVLEHWRDQLIQGGNDALTAFIAEYQPTDIQHLRQLIKKAVDEKKNEKNMGASKALFRYLRTCIIDYV
jgi:ribosome-associated protein